MGYLVRIYKANSDKINISVTSLEKALALIEKTEDDIKVKVPWLSFEDIFFVGTKNYIRKIK